MGRREGEDGQGFGDVLLEPVGKCGRGLVVTADPVLESPVGLGAVVGVVDAPDVIGDFDPHRDLGDMSHGVLARVELATLPGHSGNGGVTRRLEPCVVIADDELHAVHASFLEALKELPPVSLGLTPRDAAAEDRPLAVGGDSDGGEHCTGHDGSAMADLFVPSVEDQVGDLTEWPVPPGGQLFIELGSCPTDLSRGDLKAAELLDDFGDLPGADALDVHLGDREGHGPFTANPAIEALGVEGASLFIVVFAGLRDPKVDLAHPGMDGLRLESVGVALTVGRSLMRLGLEHLLPLDLHSDVHDDAKS